MFERSWDVGDPEDGMLKRYPPSGPLYLHSSESITEGYILSLLRLNGHRGSNFDTLEKVFCVMVMHTDTPFGHSLANA